MSLSFLYFFGGDTYTYITLLKLNIIYFFMRKKWTMVTCIAFAITLVVCKIYRVNIIRDCELSHAYIYRLLLNSWPLAANNDNSNLPRVAKRNKACGNSIYASGRRDVQLFFFLFFFLTKFYAFFDSFTFYRRALYRRVYTSEQIYVWHVWTRVNSIRDCESSFLNVTLF